MTSQPPTDNRQLISATLKLLAYCKANDWSGYDPYDALNSKVFKALPFLDSRIPRLALTQVLKRFPFNLRPFLMIPKTQNPKAIALFLMALLKLSKLGILEDVGLIQLMVQKLIDLRSPDVQPTGNRQPVTGNPYWCWGYSFPWQTRTIIVPRGAPNLVCTVFVANALLDAYEYFSDSSAPQLLHPTFCASCLEMATSAAEYVQKELYWEEGDDCGLSYPLPSSRSRVHNANFLGAALLCRIHKHLRDKMFLDPALRVARYSAAQQHEDGSWDYGAASKQRWVDNFHTGYNLCALLLISNFLETGEFESHIRRGFEFYRDNFFRNDGAAKYFHDRTYPIDIHSVAQSIITLLAFRDLDEKNLGLAINVYKWAAANMSNGSGYYYYQKLPYYTAKLSYMRWSQAWMLLALSKLLETVNS